MSNLICTSKPSLTVSISPSHFEKLSVLSSEMHCSVDALLAMFFDGVILLRFGGNGEYGLTYSVDYFT